jgi:hypothetical protein
MLTIAPRPEQGAACRETTTLVGHLQHQGCMTLRCKYMLRNQGWLIRSSSGFIDDRRSGYMVQPARTAGLRKDDARKKTEARKPPFFASMAVTAIQPG